MAFLDETETCHKICQRGESFHSAASTTSGELYGAPDSLWWLNVYKVIIASPLRVAVMWLRSGHERLLCLYACVCVCRQTETARSTWRVHWRATRSCAWRCSTETSSHSDSHSAPPTPHSALQVHIVTSQCYASRRRTPPSVCLSVRPVPTIYSKP